MSIILSPLGPADIFTSHRPLPSQTQPGYQEPPCFVPMAEPLFSGGGSLMGARGLPASPEAPLLPSTLLQVSRILARGLRLPVPQASPLTLLCLLQPGGASQLGLQGAFLGPELPSAPLPPEPPTAAPGSLSPQLQHKPLLQYGLPGKCLGLEPPGPHYAPPVPSPGAPLLGPDPPFSSTSAPRSKFPYASSTGPSLLAHPASPLSAPCFAAHAPGLGYAAGMVPLGYPGPATPQILPPALLGDPRFVPPKGLPQGRGGRLKAKPGGTKAKKMPGPPAPPHLAVPSACLSQLLTTGNGAERWRGGMQGQAGLRGDAVGGIRRGILLSSQSWDAGDAEQGAWLSPWWGSTKPRGEAMPGELPPAPTAWEGDGAQLAPGLGHGHRCILPVSSARSPWPCWHGWAEGSPVPCLTCCQCL